MLKLLNRLNEHYCDKTREKHWWAFSIAFFAAMIMFLPYMIFDNGYFLFFGDFNVQQVPFYQLAHEAVREGNILWNWNTDLGVNFIGSYSFYLLFSPFFWLTLPFPNSFVPYLMAPLLALKFAVMAMTAYCYISYFAKNKNAALIGGLLYAFSGFSVYNIFFNHFHDAMAFFPLLLLTLERLVYENKRGQFALCVALCLMVNYFFFVGEVVFLIIYFFIRIISDKTFKISIKKFFQLAFESILGVGIVAAVALPSYLAIADNSRLDSILTGFNMLVYSNEQRYFDIIKNLFYPPDLPSRPNFFPDSNAKWSSVAAWFPLISMSGVIAFISAKPKTWIKRIIIFSGVMAMIPILNHAFVAFNAAYYCRWFYMPILIMALATAHTFEDPEIDLMKGVRWTTVCTLPFVVLGFIPVWENQQYIFKGVVKFQDRFWAYVAIAVSSILIMFLLTKFFRKKENFLRLVTICLVFVFLTYSILFIGLGKTHSYNDQWIIRTGLEAEMDLDDDGFFRVDVYKGMDNQAMFWNLPTIQAFHSIVPASVLEFYPSVGVQRGVASRPENQFYGIRALTSVEYYFVDQTKSNPEILPGFSYYGTQNEFKIYKNDYYIPMGFTYEYAMTRSQYNSIPESQRHLGILKAIVLEDIDYVRYVGSGAVKAYPEENLTTGLNENGYYENCKKLQKNTCSTFEIDNTGFSAEIDLKEKQLVFFSVPNDDGWTATVNGKKVKVIDSNVGFMAVECEAGHNEIRFNYLTPGLVEGLAVSFVFIAIFLMYIYLPKLFKKYSR